MEINKLVTAIIIIAVIGFVYIIIKRNKKDLKDLEKELKEKEIHPKKHDENHV